MIDMQLMNLRTLILIYKVYIDIKIKKKIKIETSLHVTHCSQPLTILCLKYLSGLLL